MKHAYLLAALIALSSCANPNATSSGNFPVLNQTAQTRRFGAWQYALEHNAGGKATSWGASAQVRGSIAPIETVFSSTDGWCRTYEELIAKGTKRYRLVGIACRKPGARWLVLDVRPFAETSRTQ